MGVHNGAKLLERLSGLALGQLCSYSRKKAEGAGRGGHPASAGDISWLSYKLRRSTIADTIDLMVALILTLVVDEGLFFYAVFDPEKERHHTKKASFRREFERQESILACVAAKTKIMSISKDLRQGNFENEQQKSILSSNLKCLEKKVKKGEKTIEDMHRLPGLVKAARQAIQELAQLHPGKILIVEGKYQADSYLQHLLTAKTVDFVIGNDTDFSVIAGRACLQVTDFKIDSTRQRKNNKQSATTSTHIKSTRITNVIIRTGFKSTMNQVRSYLGDSVGEYTAAELPLLDNVDDLRTRCLIAVLFGNDTFPKELKRHTCFDGMGPAAVRDMIKRIKHRGDEVTFDVLLTEALDTVPQKNKDNLEKAQLSPTVIKALVEAMAFEPATVANSGDMLYSVSPPVEPLDHYMKDFVVDSSLVKEECELGTCPGPTPSHTHTFMVGEGTRDCVECSKQYCQLCVTNENVCIPCCSGATNANDDSVIRMSEEQLRSSLGEKLEVPAVATMGELQELYACVIDGNAMDSLGPELLEQVRYPRYQSAVLKHDEGTLNFIARFDFRDGARFLRDPNLSAFQRCSIINLLATLVTFPQAKDVKDGGLPQIAEVLPSMISKFASEARVDKGERLMKRCVRHGVDTKTPSILHAHGSIVDHQGEIGMVIHDRIAPSFKDGVYSVTCAFTASDLLANKCDCKAGAEAGKTNTLDPLNHFCVHCLPVLYKLVILLMDGLAEHALVEFASCFGQHEESELDEAIFEQLRESILTLMDAAGFTSEEPISKKPPHELLQIFSVGTEKGRTKVPDPPDPSKLGPIRGFKRVSPTEKAKVMLKMKQEGAKQPFSEVNLQPEEPGQADYVTVWRLCRLLAKSLESESDLMETEIVGLRLLEMRADACNVSAAVLEAAENGLRPQIMDLFKKAKTRQDPRSKGTLSRRVLHQQFKASVDSTTTKTRQLPESQKTAKPRAIVRRFVPTRTPTKCIIPVKAKKRSGKRYLRRCAFANCDHCIDLKSIAAPKMPPVPNPDKNGQVSDVRWTTYYKKKLKRCEFLRRIGASAKDDRRDLRICGDHPLGTTSPKTTVFQLKDPATGKTKRQSVRLAFDNFPIPLGRKSNRVEAPTLALSKGNGQTRQLAGFLKPPKSDAAEEVLDLVGAILTSEGVSDVDAKLQTITPKLQEMQKNNTEGLKALQQACEVNESGRNGLEEIHPSIRKLAGLDQHVATPQKKLKPNPSSEEGSGTAPILEPDSVNNDEVKRCTGFASLLLLLFYIVIVCNGNLTEMTETTTSLTWFEEWFFFFEMVWGRSLLRWVDAQAKYRIHRNCLSEVFDRKLAIVMRTIGSWPRYAYHDEDVRLRSKKWKERYANKRVVMWDNTNVDFIGKPSDADLQRLTYSLYYGGNVAKGGIFLQLCGWIGGWELWHGAVSDSDYMEKSGILSFQERFQKADPNPGISFTNILDKGYRCLLAAWRAGGQLLLQPFFAKSDRKFSSREVLLSGVVASDRSANERAVKNLKASRMIARGIHQRNDLERTADLWIAWGFQCNFMFKPVL